MKFKFQAPVFFSSTFKALNLVEKIQDFQGCVGTLFTTQTRRRSTSQSLMFIKEHQDSNGLQL